MNSILVWYIFFNSNIDVIRTKLCWPCSVDDKGRLILGIRPSKRCSRIWPASPRTHVYFAVFECSIEEQTALVYSSSIKRKVHRSSKVGGLSYGLGLCPQPRTDTAVLIISKVSSWFGDLFASHSGTQINTADHVTCFLISLVWKKRCILTIADHITWQYHSNTRNNYNFHLYLQILTTALASNSGVNNGDSSLFVDIDVLTTDEYPTSIPQHDYSSCSVHENVPFAAVHDWSKILSTLFPVLQ